KRHPHILASSVGFKTSMIQSRVIRLSLLIAALGGAMVGAATAQTPLVPPSVAQPVPQLTTAMQISWEVRNRFRLFREERDFQL
ncbi:hypothetical protein ABTN21_19130, partial [Acinetobacter baumannii]